VQLHTINETDYEMNMTSLWLQHLKPELEVKFIINLSYQTT